MYCIVLEFHRITVPSAASPAVAAPIAVDPVAAAIARQCQTNPMTSGTGLNPDAGMLMPY